MNGRGAPTISRQLAGIAVGVFCGTVALSALRVLYYLSADIRPEMSPMMFLLFSPLVATAILVISIPLELLLNRLIFRPATTLHAVVLGLSYTTVLLGLISTWGLLCLLVFNPVCVRLFSVRRPLP